MYIVKRDLDSLLEINCDLSVTRKMNNNERLSYLGTIITVIEKLVFFKKRPALVSVAFASGGDMTQRFKAVLNSVGRAKFISGLLYATLIISLAISFVFLVQPAGYPPIEDLEGYLHISQETSYILEDANGIYHLVYNDTILFKLQESDLHTLPYSKLIIIKETEGQ